MTIAQSLDNECTVQLTKCQKYSKKYDRDDLKRQVFIAVCLNIGHVVIGYTVCWTAPVIQKLQSPDLTPLDKPITDENASWIAAILNVGVIIGSQTGAYLSNVIGRKPTLLLAALLLFTSNVILLLSKNFTSLVVGRVVSGLGVGGTACGNLVYIGEIASPEVRGIILTCTGLLHTLGNLLVFSVGPFVSYSVVEYIVIVMTATHVLGLLSIPESPVYHVIKGNDDAARDTLKYLGRSKDIETELKTMIENAKDRRNAYTRIEDSKPLKPRWTWLDIFGRKRNRKALFITSTLLVIQEGAGIVCIIFFATSIFQKAASSVKPDLATIILGIAQVFGILLAPILVEKFGRRTLLIFSTSTCALWTALLGTHFYLESINHPSVESIRWAPLAILVSFLFCYNAGLGIIPNVLVGEMFSPNVRSTGSSIAMCLGWVAGFTSGLSFGYIIIIIGSHAIFLSFAVINILGCLFTLKFVPETKGKSLTEIEAMLAR
ncbi:facilitated trehalose transporter Tret1-like [Choristoneura fumiferana]|uniref:facilitated trehalose transporter Tret1-like n=1 Tax=Choristoneura fumiferana TaxID=7141 RepID=UPI003D15AF60